MFVIEAQKTRRPRKKRYNYWSQRIQSQRNERDELFVIAKEYGE